jgi:hypothetical protein
MIPCNAKEDVKMTNGTNPSEMAVEERMAEVSMLLSLAMMRLWLRRRGACGPASEERAISRDYSLGTGVENRPPVVVG